MAGDDPLDRETSVSAELTPSGVKASAKSRLVSAMDRLGGNIVELANTRLEEGISKRRAKIDGEKALIEAAVKFGIERMGEDREFVERALGNLVEGAALKQRNKDAVLQNAIEDLRNDPPTDAESSSGPETIDEQTLNRIEAYAEGATSEEIRERFGKVLATEVRKPGTFSAKSLRVIDELDQNVAKLFERLLSARWGDAIIKGLVQNLTYMERASLVEAGLIIEPGLGQVRQFAEFALFGEQNDWVTSPGKSLLCISRSNEEIKVKKGIDENEKVISISKGKPVIPIYILTETGVAIASTKPSNEIEVSIYIREKMISQIEGDRKITVLAPSADGTLTPVWQQSSNEQG